MFREIGRLVRELSGLRRALDARTFRRYCFGLVKAGRSVIRSRSLIPADERMAGHDLVFRAFGVRILLEGVDFSGAREMYGRLVYFTPPEFRIHKTDTVVDLGANRGLFTALGALLGRRVVSVEAQGRFVPEIARRLDRNGCSDKVRVVFGLVGPGTGMFADEATLRAGSHFDGPPPRFRMESLLNSEGVDRVDFLKIDIEGSEFDLLQSDNDWLDRVDRIAMEVHSRFGDPGALVRLFAAKGFETRAFDPQLNEVSQMSLDGYLFAWRAETGRTGALEENTE